MSKYGYCENCGCVMEVVGCSNCDEIDVIRHFQSSEDEKEAALNDDLYSALHNL